MSACQRVAISLEKGTGVSSLRWIKSAFHAPTNDQSHACPDQGSYPGDSLAAFAGLPAGRIAGAGHDGPVLAGDAM